MRALSWLGLLLTHACAGTLPGSGVHLRRGELLLSGKPVVAPVNAIWMAPSGEFVAFSRIVETRPSEPPERGPSELMPFYSIGIVEIQSAAVVLECVPPSRSSVPGKAWVSDSFMASTRLGASTVSLELAPKTRRIHVE